MSSSDWFYQCADESKNDNSGQTKRPGYHTGASFQWIHCCAFSTSFCVLFYQNIECICLLSLLLLENRKTAQRSYLNIPSERGVYSINLLSSSRGTVTASISVIHLSIKRIRTRQKKCLLKRPELTLGPDLQSTLHDTECYLGKITMRLSGLTFVSVNWNC